MIKKSIAVGLIVLTGGAYLYLDYQNKLEMRQLEEMRRAVEQARLQALAEAKAMAVAKNKFDAQIELDTCKATAERAKEDFLSQNRKPVRNKPGQFTIPESAVAEAAQKLEAANTACQTKYENRLKSGT